MKFFAVSIYQLAIVFILLVATSPMGKKQPKENNQNPKNVCSKDVLNQN